MTAQRASLYLTTPLYLIYYATMPQPRCQTNHMRLPKLTFAIYMCACEVFAMPCHHDHRHFVERVSAGSVIYTTICI